MHSSLLTVTFVIINRRIDVDIDGLGLLGFMLEPLTEGVMNLVRDQITTIFETEVKDLLQDILGETPWPAL